MSAPAPGRLLLVDDDDDIRSVAQLSLEHVGGWEVVAVASGAEALQAVREGAFSAIVLDVMMPGLDGPSTLARLRAAGVQAPAVFLTAKLQPADRRALHETGAVGLVPKPFDPMRLPDELARILEGVA